jgi:hypothetical protein
MDSWTGSSATNVDSIDEAEKIAQGCPIIIGVRVYEATSMQSHPLIF